MWWPRVGSTVAEVLGQQTVGQSSTPSKASTIARTRASSLPLARHKCVWALHVGRCEARKKRNWGKRGYRKLLPDLWMCGVVLVGFSKPPLTPSGRGGGVPRTVLGCAPPLPLFAVLPPPIGGCGGLVGPPGDDSSAEGHPAILAHGRYAAVSTLGAPYKYAWWCCR